MLLYIDFFLHRGTSSPEPPYTLPPSPRLRRSSPKPQLSATAKAGASGGPRPRAARVARSLRSLAAKVGSYAVMLLLQSGVSAPPPAGPGRGSPDGRRPRPPPPAPSAARGS